MKKTTLSAALFSVSLILSAQKKYEKALYHDVSIDAVEMTVMAKDIVSLQEAAKFKLKISNKTSDILLYKPEESLLKTGNLEVRPVEKWMQIQPSDADSKVINFKGNGYQQPSISYEVNGLYRISTSAGEIPTPDFSLPASNNEFKTGNFTCNLLQLNKETDKTAVRFECRYNGNQVGVIQPIRASIKLPDGTEVANSKTKTAPIVLMKGESDKFNMVWDRMEGGKATDMQKVKLMIVWNNTFIETEAIKLPPTILEFKLDEAKSK